MKIGEYKRGADATTDEALDKIDRINAFLRQRTDERSSFEETLGALEALTK